MVKRESGSAHAIRRTGRFSQPPFLSVVRSEGGHGLLRLRRRDLDIQQHRQLSGAIASLRSTSHRPPRRRFRPEWCERGTICGQQNWAEIGINGSCQEPVSAQAISARTLVEDSYILPRDLVTSQAKRSARSVVEPPNQFPDLEALVSVQQLIFGSLIRSN